MTGAIASLAIGSDQREEHRRELNPFDALYFVGLLLFVLTFIAQPPQRAVRAAREEELLMSAIAPLRRSAATVERGAARARRRDVARHDLPRGAAAVPAAVAR